MPLIIRIIIITVDDPHRIVKLQPVFEAEPAAGITFEDPLRLHPDADACRNLYRLARCQRDICRSKEIVSGASCGGTSRQTDSIIDFLYFAPVRNPQGISPSFQKLFKTYLFKSCYSLHETSPLYTCTDTVIRANCRPLTCMDPRLYHC